MRWTPGTRSWCPPPQGSGKTLVAAYAVHRALSAHGKAFYTTPLKALSNQKYGELAAAYGEEHVGLLTGDTTLRPRAPVVVMTTEVLRNMLLAGSDLLEGLHTVVLDEVHFIQDPYRGGVWEEVLVLCPAEVRFVCLSATVNNADELGGWLRSVRGDTSVIVERQRPIVLRHHFAVYRREDEETLLCPLLQDNGQPGGEGLRIDQAVRRALQGGRSAHWRGRGRGPRLPFRAPRRTEMVEELGRNEMLPAIVFIFSRAACDDAVHQVVRDGVRLTDSAERAAIRAGGRAPGGAAGRRRSRRPRLRRVARRTRARRGRTPRRPGPGLSRDGGGVLRGGVAQGRLRHRDAVARDQHAGPLRRDRALHQVRRGRAGHAHVRRVPAAHGPCGAPRARRRGPCRGRLVQRDHLRRGRPGGVGPSAQPAVRLPAHLQPRGQPRLPLRPGDGRRRAAALLRPVAGPHTGPALAAAGAPGRRSGADGLPRRLERHALGAPAVPHLPRGRPPDRRGARGRPPGRVPSPPCSPASSRPSCSSRAGPAVSPANRGPDARSSASRCRIGSATSAVRSWPGAATRSPSWPSASG